MLLMLLNFKFITRICGDHQNDQAVETVSVQRKESRGQKGETELSVERWALSVERFLKSL